MSRLYLGVIFALVAVLTFGSVAPVMAAGYQSASKYALSTGPTFQTYGDSIHKYVSYTFTLVNGSSRQVLIRKIGQNGPGLQLLIASRSGGRQTLSPKSRTRTTKKVLPHKSIRLTVWFHVSDCAKVPNGDWPLAMDVSWNARTWQRVNLQMTSAGSMQWQKFIADSVCP